MSSLTSVNLASRHDCGIPPTRLSSVRCPVLPGMPAEGIFAEVSFAPPSLSACARLVDSAARDRAPGIPGWDSPLWLDRGSPLAPGARI